MTTESPIRIGVDTAALSATLDALKSDAEIARSCEQPAVVCQPSRVGEGCASWQLAP